MKYGKMLLVGALVAVLSLGTIAGISFAADKESTSTAAKGFVNGCRGFVGGAMTELSKLLGLTPEEIVQQRSEGKSLADIAKDQKVDKDKVVSTMMDAREKMLAERVKAGYITQEQADQILARMKARTEQRIENSSVGPGRGMMGGGCGMGGGGCGTRRGTGGFGPGAGYRSAPPTTQGSI